MVVVRLAGAVARERRVAVEAAKRGAAAMQVALAVAVGVGRQSDRLCASVAYDHEPGGERVPGMPLARVVLLMLSPPNSPPPAETGPAQ